MEKLLANLDSILFAVALAVIGLNIVLTAAKRGLEYFMDRTVSDIDNRAHSAISKVLFAAHKVLALASANTTYLPPKVKAELERAKSQGIVDAQE